MQQIEMVRCKCTDFHTKMKRPERPICVRYIPLELFHIWKYLMENIEGITVLSKERSIWMDEEMYSRQLHSLGEHELDLVDRVCFDYFGPATSSRPVIRYYSTDELNGMLAYMSRNFPYEPHMTQINRTQGFFIVVSKSPLE